MLASCGPYTLSTTKLYFIGHTINETKLRGKRVWWTGKFMTLPFDGGKLAVCRMATTTLDFKEGEEWSIRPAFLMEVK